MRRLVEALFLTFLIGLYGMLRSEKYHEVMISVQIASISPIVSISLLSNGLEFLSLLLLGVESCIFVFFVSMLFLSKRGGVGFV